MQEFIVPFIIIFVMIAIFAIPSRYSAEKNENGDQVLSYAFPAKFFGVVLFAAASVLSILFFSKFVKIHPEEMFQLLLCVLFFILLTLSVLAEFLFVKYYINPESICSNTPWSKKRTIYWQEVNSIRYSPSLSWIVIKDGINKPIRVNYAVSGIYELLETIKEQTPKGIYEQLEKDFQ